MVECMFFDVRYRIHLDIVWLHGYGPHSISVSLSPFFSNTCAQSISYMYMLIHSKGMVYCTLSLRCVLLNCLIKLKLVILVYSFSYNDWITSSTCNAYICMDISWMVNFNVHFYRMEVVLWLVHLVRFTGKVINRLFTLNK